MEIIIENVPKEKQSDVYKYSFALRYARDDFKAVAELHGRYIEETETHRWYIEPVKKVFNDGTVHIFILSDTERETYYETLENREYTTYEEAEKALKERKK